jgi:exopolysaccharide biosynthesis protein
MPDYPSLEIRTLRTTTREFLLQARQRGQDMVLAVNSNGWRPWEKPFNHKYGGNLGLIISDGQLVSEPSRGPSLLVYRDGRVTFTQVGPDADLSGVQTAVSGFSFVLEKGEVTSKDKSLHPRTGYGLSEDRRYLILLTIDGRQAGYSEGATTAEVAEWLRHFGAWEGLNMDGGGSTTLVYWDTAAAAVRRVNHQSGGAERRVGCSLGIVLAE